MTKQDYPVYEEVVISVIQDNHNPSKIPLFMSDEILNIWILPGFSFDLNGWLSVSVFQKRMREACQDEIFQLWYAALIVPNS